MSRVQPHRTSSKPLVPPTLISPLVPSRDVRGAPKRATTATAPTDATDEELLFPIEIEPPPILTAAETADELAWRRQAYALNHAADEEPLESPSVQARLRRLQALMSR